MDKSSVLKRYFGHTAFRPGQEELIDAVLAGRDVLGVMPTGGGKSICYQVPALLLPGVTLVISPLISLMKDQVSALREAGVDASFLNSSMTPDQLRRAYARAWQGADKLLYIAPERLEGDGFAALMREQNVSLVAVDEAHCISQWGQDFRPSYLHIADFVDSLPSRPVMAAFTATATEAVRQDIAQRLRLNRPLEILTGFDRPNLYFDVLCPKDKTAALCALLDERRGKSGIVYCATRVAVERVCETLCARGVPATRYHAGLSDEERRSNQDDFQYDRRPVMVATNAFGMGIDKSNVAFVIHYNMPKSLEAYYQEAGRAGRDGESADCILLYSPGDVTTARFLIENRGGGEELSAEEQALVRRRDYERLDTMTGYCKSTTCLRGRLLDYFGQKHEENCGNCGVCRAGTRRADITREAQMILSCAVRIRERLGYCVGASLLEKTLRGSADKRVLALGLDNLPTYGLLRPAAHDTVRRWIDALENAGYLALRPEFASLEPTARAASVLFHDERVEVSVRAEAAPARGKKRAARAPSAVPEEGGLLAALKAVRLRIAQEEGVPAYIVFSNAALADMAVRAPRTNREFLEVSGVGSVKAERYGRAFLAAIAAYDGS